MTINGCKLHQPSVLVLDADHLSATATLDLATLMLPSIQVNAAAECPGRPLPTEGV
jgi:hypothetical protein